MVYNVNAKELGINDLLQLVEILLGEGKDFYLRLPFTFYENSNHI